MNCTAPSLRVRVAWPGDQPEQGSVHLSSAHFSPQTLLLYHKWVRRRGLRYCWWWQESLQLGAMPEATSSLSTVSVLRTCQPHDLPEEAFPMPLGGKNFPCSDTGQLCHFFLALKLLSECTETWLPVT